MASDGNIEQSNFDIAVIGMSGRFPGAGNIGTFWQNLCSGVEAITLFSDDELKESGVSPLLLKDKDYVKAAPLLDKPEYFDASFFGYSPREATTIDPQQRVILECAWEAMERAGYNTERYDGSIAVFAGASMNTYFLASGLSREIETDGLTILIGSDKDFLATRISYKLNLKGPSLTVGTGCSTSLVAIHLACQSLLNEECNMALAGGVSISFPHRTGYLYRPGGIDSPDGHCRAFDADAQGTIFGSGAGIVVLKKLDDALADGDYIHAIIKGTAVNNDGNAKVGYTAPSVEGQSKVILEALANSGVEADTISYIEAHGTATALGDPIEVTALTEAFRHYTDKNGFCSLGSVKTNIGHLDVAAGVAGFIKTVLALEHKMIPASLHYKKHNPEIDFQNSPFFVNNQSVEWQPQSNPRRAGVSSFGVGGTNAHVILEESPVVTKSGESRPWQLLLISAKTDAALEDATSNLNDYLKRHPSANIADIAYTLQVGRKPFSHRRIVVCRDRDDAVNALESSGLKRVIASVREPVKPSVVFVFSGQGSQYVNMARELYETEPVFQEEVDRCAEILQSHLNLDLRDIIYPAEKDAAKAEQTLLQTYVTQPALFTIEYALARLWMKWGIYPEAMVGHSIGEYVAACLSGVFSLEDALSLVAARGRLMQEQPGGSMLAVFLSEEEIRPILNSNLSLAVINGPSLCVVSGEEEAVKAFEKQLSEKNITTRHIHTSHAFHSTMMEPILDAFTEQVKQVSLNNPQIPFVSNVTGTWITIDEAVNPAYWANHLRRTVRYSDCLQELFKEPNRVILEVGPGGTFSSLAQQHPSRTKEHIVLSSIRHPKEQKSDVAFILGTLGELWLAGIDINWLEFYANEIRHRLPLPTYPFERQRHWYEAGEQKSAIYSVIPKQTEESKEPGFSELTNAEKKKQHKADATESNFEQVLVAIWQDTLGIKQVNIDDDFFDLGGNSLMAVRLFARIEKEIGKKLPLATLLQAPTLRQMGEFLKDENAEPSWDSMVKMKSGGAKPPLFLVHAGGGNVLIFHNLVSRLKPEQAIYGLQSPGLNGNKPFLNSIEDMAASYLQEIKSVQPEGPYILGGFCMGGTVALEMAQQLQSQGQEVALLIFMETYNWSNITTDSLFDDFYYYLQKIVFNFGRLLSGERGFVKRRIEILREKFAPYIEAIKIKHSLKINKDNGQHSLLYELEENNDMAALNYMPKTYPGKTVHFIAGKEYARNKRLEPGWNKIILGGIESCELPVYPRQMLAEPFVSLLAEKMMYYISPFIS